MGDYKEYLESIDKERYHKGESAGRRANIP